MFCLKISKRVKKSKAQKRWSQVFSHHNIIQKINGSYDRDNNKIVMHEGIEGNYSMRRTIHTRKSYIMER